MASNDNKGPNVASPTPFDGNRSKSKYFLQQCELVFNAREKDFLTGTPGTVNEKAKIAYALSYMKGGNALAWASTIIEGGLPATWSDFVTKFKDTFKPINNDEKARGLIQKLVQGKHSVDAYTATFNTWKADTKYNQEALIDAYMRGLNRDIRQRIEQMDQIPDKLDTIQEKAASFDIRRDTNQMRFGNWNRPVYPDTDFTAPRTQYQGRFQNQGTRNDPIIINRANLTQEERAQIMKEGRCFKCRQKGHMARECPEYQGGGRPNQQGYQRNNYQRPQNNSRPPIRARVTQIMDIVKDADPEELGEIMMAIREGQDFTNAD
jgi:hypothetical protein